MSGTKIKICGITNVTDALNAIEAGADYLGLIFVSTSPRSVNGETAKTIADNVKKQSPHIKIVGVFQNASIAEIEAVIKSVPLDLVQLHGEESVDLLQTIPIPVIKTILIDSATQDQKLEPYQSRSNLYAFLFDLPKGTQSLSIAEAPLPLTSKPCFIAGKLNANNVANAIRQWRPFGVDVASGVESEPGQKSIEKMNAFCKAVKETHS